MKLGLPICLLLVWAFVHEANTGKIDGNNLRLLESEEYENEFGLMMMEGQMDRLNPYGMMTEGQMDRELEASNRFLMTAYLLGKAGYVVYKCRDSAQDAAKALANIRSATVKKLEQQMPNIKKGDKSGVIEALKDIISPTGAAYKAVEEAAGCMANYYGYTAFSVSGTVELAAGASSSIEVGIGKSFSKSDTMVFLGTCQGIKTDISLGGSLNVAFWKDIGSIPGTSYAAEVGMGSGIFTGAVDLGGSLGAVFAKSTGWWGIPTFTQIGNTFSVGLGAGVSPLDVSVAECKTCIIGKDC